MALGSWLILLWEQNQLAASGSKRKISKNMAHLTSTKPGFWQNVLHINRGSIMKKPLPPQKNGPHSDTLFPSILEGMENPSDGCKSHLFEWRYKGEIFYVPARRIFCEGPWTQSMKTYKIIVWPLASTASLVWEINWASSETWLQTFWSWLCNFLC